MSASSRTLRRFCTLVVVGAAVLVGPGAADAASIPLAWGCGGSGTGECALPGGLAGSTAVDAGDVHSLALKGDGTVAAWGCGFDFGQCIVPGGLAGVTAISAGFGQSLALRNDGTVAAWGCGSIFAAGQCTVPGGLSGVTAISAGLYHSLALKGDGTVVAWGCSGHDFGQCTVPGGLSSVTAIAAGGVHSLALKNDGTVVAWGCEAGSDMGQCTVPMGLAGVTAISANRSQSLVLKGDGTVVAWGCGGLDYGQCDVPGGLAGVTAIAAGYAHSLALKSDGTVVAWGCEGDFDVAQCRVPTGLSGVTAISAGDFHSLALAELQDQTITFPPIPDRRWGDPGFIPSATASSGLPVTFSVSGACILINGVVYAASGGICTVTASQPGGLNFNPAPDVSRTFRIARLPQAIFAFAPIDDKTVGDPEFVVTAFSTSGLPVSFSADGSCTVAAAVVVHLTGAGSCTITASQGGDVNWEPAPDVSQTFSITRPVETFEPERCRVPSVVGKRLAAARRLIARRHCRTGRVGRAYSRRKRGMVLRQSRRPGTVLRAGSRINLVVSRGRRR